MLSSKHLVSPEVHGWYANIMEVTCSEERI